MSTLLDLIPAAGGAVFQWQAGTPDAGSFVVTDSDLLVFSDQARRDFQDELVALSSRAGVVVEWRRDHPASRVTFTWRRLEVAS